MFFSQPPVLRLEFGDLPQLRLRALLLRFDFMPRLPEPDSSRSIGLPSSSEMPS